MPVQLNGKCRHALPHPLTPRGGGGGGGEDVALSTQGEKCEVYHDPVCLPNIVCVPEVPDQHGADLLWAAQQPHSFMRASHASALLAARTDFSFPWDMSSLCMMES